MNLISIFKSNRQGFLDNVALFLLRVSFGGTMLIGHGYGKFMKLFGEEAIKFANPLGIGEYPTFLLAVLTEFICAILLILGLGTRISALLLMCTMFVAAFFVHIDDPFNRFELPYMYLIGFLVVFLCGAGRFSLDRLFFKRT